MNLRKHISLLLVFALGFTIARPYFIAYASASIQDSTILQKYEKGTLFSKLVWQLEEENEEGDDTGLKVKFLNLPYSQTITNQFNESLVCSKTDFKVFHYPSANKTPLFLIFGNFRI